MNLFLYFLYIVSIVMLLIAGIITATFVIPLQIKEADVKNGLSKLRKQILIRGVFSLIVIIFSGIALSTRFFISDVVILRYVISGVVLFFSLSVLVKSFIDFQIYHEQFTPAMKKLHNEVYKLEKKERRMSKK